MSTDTRPASRRETARRRIEAKRAAENAAREQAARRRRTVLGGVGVGVALVVLLVVVIAVQTARTATPASAAVPANTTDEGTVISVGATDAPVAVDVYADFQCPACRQFDAVAGDTLDALAADGTVRLRFHPIAILDRYSTTAYSTRSLNAAGVVADAAGPEAFARFSAALYDRQPPEGTAGLSDDELIALAAEAGAAGERVESGIRDLVYEDWTERVTEAASKRGVNSTPTVVIAGEPLDLREVGPQRIRDLVEAAAGR